MGKWLAIDDEGKVSHEFPTRDEAFLFAFPQAAYDFSPFGFATDPPVSEKQRRAMYAAKAGKSTLGIPKKVGEEFVGEDGEPVEPKGHAAGIIFVAPDGDILLLRRSGKEANYAHHWALPGGGAEDGESPEQTATREAQEEMQGSPKGKLKLMDRRITPTGLAFYTFVQPVESKFTPKLNHEHSGYCWSSLDQLPQPMHPAVGATLNERLYPEEGSADMTPDDWQGLRDGFAKWTREEEEESEHAEDDESSYSDDLLQKWSEDVSELAEDAKFEESKHPRGQPENAGQFAEGEGSKSSSEGGKSSSWQKELKSYKVNPGAMKDGVSEKGMRFPNEPVNQAPITTTEGSAIGHWTTPGSKSHDWSAINSFLRKGNGKLNKAEKLTLDTLTKVTEKARLEKDAQFTRFYDASLAKKLDQMKPGDVLGDKGFVSVSGADLGDKYGSKLIKKRFPGGGKMQILAPKGSKVFATWRYANVQNEVEYTIARNSKLQYLGDKDGVKYFKLLPHSKQAKDINSDALAMDEASVRTFDADGRMHVALTNISKANICPYYGREIPNDKEMGLDPEKLYYLLRDPTELEKAAPTFNNIPLLNKHEPVNATDHKPELIIGSTGTDAVFVGPYLKNSLVVWAQDAIAQIERGTRKELSCAYRYRADMTPGEYQGEHYDGIMRDLIGNHVALVENGRAGADVIVGDAAIPTLMELFPMTKPIALSRTAAMVKGALLVSLRPKLAQDAQLDLNPILKDLTHKNFKDQKASILSGLTTSLKGKLAKDASVGDLTTLMDALENVNQADTGMDDTMPSAATGSTLIPGMSGATGTMDAGKEFLKGKLSAEDMAAYDALCAGKAMDAEEDDDEDEDDKDKKKGKPFGEDEDDDDKDDEKKEKKGMDKKAMDAAITAGVTAERKRNKDIREAERDVRPYVGELAIAFDSAEEIYRHALKALNVEVKDVHASALPTILKMQPKPGDKKFAQDQVQSSAKTDFAQRFPMAARINA